MERFLPQRATKPLGEEEVLSWATRAIARSAYDLSQRPFHTYQTRTLFSRRMCCETLYSLHFQLRGPTVHSPRYGEEDRTFSLALKNGRSALYL